MDIELKDLRLVKMIAETGNLTRAAERLNISQPSLSRQLQLLEARIGASLFHRLTKKMLLTDIGQEVLQIADEIQAKLGQTERNIARRLGGSAGELKLGVHCTPSFTWLPDVLLQFQQRFPDVSLSVTGTDDYVRDFDLGRIEIAITHFHHGDIKRGVAYENLFSADIVAIMAPGHPLAGKPQLAIEDFGGHEYISLLEKADDPFYNFILKPCGVEPKNVNVVSQAQALMTMVASSQGLSLLPEFIVNELVAAGRLKTAGVGGVPLNTTWLVAHRDNQELSEHARAFVEMIRATIPGSLAA